MILAKYKQVANREEIGYHADKHSTIITLWQRCQISTWKFIHSQVMTPYSLAEALYIWGKTQSPLVHIRQLASLFAPVLILKPLKQRIQNGYVISTEGVVPFNSLLLHFNYCPTSMYILLIPGCNYLLELEDVFTRNIISPGIIIILHLYIFCGTSLHPSPSSLSG